MILDPLFTFKISRAQHKYINEEKFTIQQLNNIKQIIKFDSFKLLVY